MAPDSKTATLQLLGCWRLMTEGRTWVVPGRDQRVIAAVALLDPLPRRRLAELLWPNGTSDRARANLRVNLSDIRSRYPGILAHSDPLALASTVTVDIASLERLPAALDHLTNRAQLWQATEFVRRAELLPGWFESWLEFDQERVRQQRLSTLDALARRFLDVGDVDGARTAAAIAVNAEPWRETSYELLMRAHALAGNRALALRVYEHARSMLLRELAVEPAPILTSLADELRLGSRA